MIEVDKLRNQIMQGIDTSSEIRDESLWEIIDEHIMNVPNIRFEPIKQREKLRKDLFASIRGLDILQDFLEDESITEIMINGPDNIFLERNGCICQYEGGFSSKQRLADVIQQIVATVNRRVNEASPIVDARLKDGSRVNVVLDPIALNGPIVTIRKFSNNIMDMERLIKLGSIDGEVARFLEKLVKAGYNIFVSGGTGSGKTTFLNVLSNYIPKEERVITIEDSAELKLQGIPNLVTMEARSENSEGEGAISIRNLIKASLRMRPDRIIVGEVRQDECIDMLQAMNTGHDGSMSTGHANSPEDMLARLETMVLMGMDIPLAAVKSQIAAGIDIMVHLGRLRDKSRRVLQVMEVRGMENGEIKLASLYRFNELGEDTNGKILGEYVRCEKLKFTQKLTAAGIKL